MQTDATVANGLNQPWAEAPVPHYERVKQKIISQIRTGAWPVHHRLPSESELVAQLGLSRMTINRALRELTAEGLLVRMQGVGTFVAEPKGHTALFEIHNIANEIASRGHVHRTVVVCVEAVRATPEIAIELSVKEGSLLYRSQLVHLENDLPVQIEDRFVNPKVAPDYLIQDFENVTPYVYLNKLAPLTEGKHIVEAVNPEPDEAKLLQIKRSEPCLLINRTTWSGKQSVSFSRLVYPGSRYRLEGRFGS